MCSATNSWLFATRKIKDQHREARGTRPRCNCRKYFACNLAKTHSHVCSGGKGTVLTLKAFRVLVCSEVWLMPYMSLSLCYTHSCSPEQSFPRTKAAVGCGSSSFTAKRSFEWVIPVGAKKVQVHNLEDHPTWVGIDPCGSGDAEEDPFCTELSNHCLCRVNSPTLCNHAYIESPPSGQTFPALWIHKTILVLWGSLWAAFHGETTWACTAQEHSQDTLSCHRDKRMYSSHHIMLPPNSGHPSGRKSTSITVGVCPAQHIWVLVGWALSTMLNYCGDNHFLYLWGWGKRTIWIITASIQLSISRLFGIWAFWITLG